MKEKLTMLVAEDNEADLALLEHAVSIVGEDVNLQVTHDGDEAISYLRGDGEYADRARHPLPDLLVLDLKMPRVEGFAVRSWNRYQPALHEVKVFILTSSDDPDDLRRATKLGADGFIVKHPSVAQIGHELRRALGVAATTG